MATIKAPKKLIEVALPLDAINEAAAREKSIRNGHPSTLHLWWARRPLAAARAVIFAQMVNDPGFQQGGGFRYGVNKEKAALERERLFKIIEDLLSLNSSNETEVLRRARAEIVRSWHETCELNKNHPNAAELFNPEQPPAFHDPFAGGGAIPYEAQRLGLDSTASDLNPVAVAINAAIIDIPARFAGNAPVGLPHSADKQQKMHEEWVGARGLAEDVRRYVAWLREQAERRLGSLYPKVLVTEEMARDRAELRSLIGAELTVVAWIWARTVRSPNPAYSECHVPLVSSFWLSKKKGQEAWIEPLVDGLSYEFRVRTAGSPTLSETVNRKGGVCVLSKSAISFQHIRSEGAAGRMSERLMALVVHGPAGKIYLSPTPEMEAVAHSREVAWKPDIEFFAEALGFRIGNYGLSKWSDLFNQRQILALTTFSDLVSEAAAKATGDAERSGRYSADGVGLAQGGRGSTAYGQAIAVYLAFIVDRLADYWSTLNGWQPQNQQLSHTFSRQALSMVWDYAEANPFSGRGGSFDNLAEWTIQSLDSLGKWGQGIAIQADASTQSLSRRRVVSTDPPYYDNIGYADLSDFFYVWLRRTLRNIYPETFATLAVPKAEELVATPARHGGKAAAERFFLEGMTQAMRRIAQQSHPAFPVTIYYAFKQADTREDGTASTGWETFLEAVISSGFKITGTWPLRTEMSHRMRGMESNALASSVVLVCQQRGVDDQTITRRQFVRELNEVLPLAMDEMTRGGVNSPVAPVDLSQAIIGPGMAIFSQYAAVLEADGTPMRVKTALQLINRFLAEDDFDHDTQFCLHWFEQQGWATGKFGEADVLARAKGTSVSGLQATGVVDSGKGDLRLLRWAELPSDWSPETDTRLPIWEALHHLIRALNQDGESAAGALLARMPARAEPIRALAYRLYTLCERKGWADDARAYNELVTAWSAIEQAAGEAGVVGSQAQLDI